MLRLKPQLRKPRDGLTKRTGITTSAPARLEVAHTAVAAAVAAAAVILRGSQRRHLPLRPSVITPVAAIVRVGSLTRGLAAVSNGNIDVRDLRWLRSRDAQTGSVPRPTWDDSLPSLTVVQKLVALEVTRGINHKVEVENPWPEVCSRLVESRAAAVHR